MISSKISVMRMVRRKEVLKRVCRAQRSIDYLYRLDLPLSIVDKIVEDGRICWCRQCNRFSCMRCDYDIVSQLYTRKGWQKVLNFSLLLDSEKSIPGWKYSHRAQWLAKKKMKICFECEKQNCWDHIRGQKKDRNEVYSNSRKGLPTRVIPRISELPTDYDDFD